MNSKYLKKLEELKLIQIDSNQQVRFLQAGTVHAWSSDEPLGEVYNNQLLDSLVKRAKVSNSKSSDLDCILGGVSLTQEQKEQFVSEYRALVKKYHEISNKTAKDFKGSRIFFSNAFLIGPDRNDFFPEVDNNI